MKEFYEFWYKYRGTTELNADLLFHFGGQFCNRLEVLLEQVLVHGRRVRAAQLVQLVQQVVAAVLQLH